VVKKTLFSKVFPSSSPMNSNKVLNSSYQQETTTPDVFIVGGGPAGLACAIAAAQQGLTVEVADGMTPPIDKACGEGLMPDTLEALAQLGIELSSTESAPFRGIRFHDADTQVSAQAVFPAAAAAGRGIRRLLLHQLLLDRATALGVHFSWQTVVKQVHEIQTQQETKNRSPARSLVRTNRHTVRPRFIVGADGHQSRVRTWASLNHTSFSAARIGLRQHFEMTTPPDFVEVYWSDHGQAYITPVSTHEICLAFIATTKFPSIQSALTHFPQLRERLNSATPTDAPRGSVTFSRKLHRVTRGNVALIGDASGSVDAVTGEGLGLCFRQSLVLAEALRQGDLAPYQQAHRAIQRLPYFMGRTMLLMDAYPFLRAIALPVLQRYPRLFKRLLSVHIGHNPRQPLHPTIIPVS
jgi:2-polyprenyl-6-methoxyphenol hydroxylase-like FAD-dependent oxidoreductase